jgi:hypothetical protein
MWFDNMDRTNFKIFLTALLIFSFFMFWTGYSEDSHFFLTRTILEEGRFEIDTFANQINVCTKNELVND